MSGDFAQLISVLLLLSVIANIYLLRRNTMTMQVIEYPTEERTKPETKEIKKLTAIEKPAIVQEVLREIPSCSNSTRNLEECEMILKASQANLLTDDEILRLLDSGKMPSYGLEKALGASSRAVGIRRRLIGRAIDYEFKYEAGLPFEQYDYTKVHGVCCENVVGYLPLPVGVAGPFRIDGKEYYIPMATTEGCLIASTSRGCKAISSSSGASTVLLADGMTRGPVLGFPSIIRAAAFKKWAETDSDIEPKMNGLTTIKEAFNSTSRFARLKSVKITLAGKSVYIRFCTVTGDAMGMNMISKGVEKALSGRIISE